jgi:hypothetical protein
MYSIIALTVTAAVVIGTVQAQAPRFSEHLIQDGYTYIYGIGAGDLDGDGDVDLTSADAFGHDSLYWLQNDGTGSFKRFLIQKEEPERLERHALGDVDGDGDLDVVIVKNLYGDLLWFRNNGTPQDGRLWQRVVITQGMPYAYDVVLSDLDGDGDLDAAASGWRGSHFYWFENTGWPGRRGWPRHRIERNIRGPDNEPSRTRTMRAGDFDGDGDPDLLGTAPDADVIIWYENRPSGATGSSGPRSNPSPVAWTRHVVNDQTRHPVHGHPVDMDGDGDLDIVMAMGMTAKPGDANSHQIAWYENDGNPAARAWTRHLIRDRFQDAFEVVAGDLDGDGDVDVAATSWRTPGRVAWFQNHGLKSEPWTMHLLKDNWRSANQILIADLDGDGRLDIVACAEKGSQELRWWRNEGATEEGP